MPIRRCPRTVTTPEALELCSLAEMVEVGILPGSGGWKEQAALFCDGARFVLNLRARYRKEQMKRGKGNP